MITQRKYETFVARVKVILNRLNDDFALMFDYMEDNIDGDGVRATYGRNNKLTDSLIEELKKTESD